MFELERVPTVKGKTSIEVVYGITSLTRLQAHAGLLLGLSRKHWGIENRLHWVRDVTLGEDACRVRKGCAAEVLAGVRNVVVCLVEKVKAASKAAATRPCAAHSVEAMHLLLT